MQAFLVRTLASLAFGGAALVAGATPASAAVGLTEVADEPDHATLTVFHPSDGDARPLRRGPFSGSLATDGPIGAGNRRLIVLSHGSGGSAWVHADLAIALVAAGFTVVVPEHRGDNTRDPGHPGPDSWTRRPAEISHAIDAVAADPRFAGRLDFDRVGLYGMSAGGHAALSLAGGRWSPARFRDHCEAHLTEDFHTCVGLATRLTGSPLDAVRTRVAMLIIRHRFDDAVDRVDRDPRIAAIVAAVPLAADFDPASLVRPVVPLGIVTAREDRWLVPRFHGDRVLAACRACEPIADVRAGGHGALLSPLPAGMTGLEGELLNDPPGFDRAAATAEVDRAVVSFFVRHLAVDGAVDAARTTGSGR